MSNLQELFLEYLSDNSSNESPYEPQNLRTLEQHEVLDYQTIAADAPIECPGLVAYSTIPVTWLMYPHKVVILLWNSADRNKVAQLLATNYSQLTEVHIMEVYK